MDFLPKSIKHCSTVPLAVITSMQFLNSKFKVLIKESIPDKTPYVTPCPVTSLFTYLELGNMMAP